MNLFKLNLILLSKIFKIGQNIQTENLDYGPNLSTSQNLILAFWDVVANSLHPSLFQNLKHTKNLGDLADLRLHVSNSVFQTSDLLTTDSDQSQIHPNFLFSIIFATILALISSQLLTPTHFQNQNYRNYQTSKNVKIIYKVLHGIYILFHQIYSSHLFIFLLIPIGSLFLISGEILKFSNLFTHNWKQFWKIIILIILVNFLVLFFVILGVFLILLWKGGKIEDQPDCSHAQWFKWYF